MADQSVKIATFTRNEEQIRRDWLRFLIEDPHAPLDVAYKANLVKIQKEYYPYAIYEMSCELTWSAKSIWEHKEERQVPVTKYQDYRGDLHNENGTDIDVVNMNTYHRRRTPVTIYETETYTVTDNVQQTSGKVGPVHFTEKVWTGPGISLIDWTDHITSKLIPLSSASQDVTILPEKLSQSSAQSEAASSAKFELTSRARKNVPGTRYENFSVGGFQVHDVCRTDALLCVYHIFYEYEGQQYECLMTGGETQKDTHAENRPKDSAIEQQHAELDEALKKNSGCRQIGLLFASALIGGWGLKHILAATTALSRGYIPGPGWILGIVLTVLAIMLLLNVLKKRREHRNATSAKEKMVADSSMIKKQILELIDNDAIPDQQKSQLIQEWIEAFKAGNLPSAEH